MKTKILTIFLIFLAIPFCSAFDASGDVYSVGSYHIGSAANTPEGLSSSARDTLTYQQAGNQNATSDIYSLNLGWFENFVGAEEAIVIVTPSGGGGVSVLFDVDILEFESPAKLGDFFDFTYFIKGVGNINNDVSVNFWIEEDGTVITSGSTVVYMGSFDEVTDSASLFLPGDIVSGTYKFVVQAYFQGNKGEAHRTIEITVEGEEVIIESLFDISFALEDTILTSSNDLVAIVTLENFGTVPIPIELNFIILDEFGNEVHRKKEEITVITEEVLRKKFLGLNLPRGNYNFVLKTLYDVDVYDEFTQEFEIIGWKIIWIFYLILGIIFVLLVCIIILIIKRRKEKKPKKIFNSRLKDEFAPLGPKIVE
jgi:hypothetical protein